MCEMEYEFLESILRKYKNDTSITVTDVCKEPACEKGENFMSVVFKLAIKGKKNENNNLIDYNISLIVKKPYQSEIMQAKFNSNEVFMNEVIAYNEIIPALKKGCKIPLSVPDCLYADKDVIILEDLTSDGYAMRRTEAQMNIDQCIEVVKEVATMHAASIILKTNQKNKLKQFSDKIYEIYNPDNATLINLVDKNLSVATILLKTSEQTDTVIDALDKIEKYRDKIYNHVCNLLKANSETCVLNHGDCWRNNILFKTTPEGIKVKLIDFQIMRFTSAAADLTYFLYINLLPEDRHPHMDLFLDTYLKAVHHILDLHNLDSNSKFYTKEWLKQEMANFSIFGFMCSLWISPAFYYEKQVLPDMENIKLEELDADYHKNFILKHMTPVLRNRIICLVLDFVQHYNFNEIIFN